MEAVMVSLPVELHLTLQKLAEAEQLTVDELVKSAVTQFISDSALDEVLLEGEVYRPDSQELAELLEAVAESEAEEAEGIEISLEEVVQEIKEEFANRRRSRGQKATA